jgi:hypothetical protein
MFNAPNYDEEEHFADHKIYIIGLPDEDDELLQDPGWTMRRVLMLLIALVMIGSLLAYFLVPALTGEPATPPPPPTPAPAPQSLA